jgi:hypothetical protein
MIEKVIENLKDRHVLLIFDNIDSIYIKKPEEFIAFLSDIFNNASKVNVLVTGFSDFEHLYKNFPLKFHDLKRLNDLDSAALLTRRAPRAILPQEIFQLFKKTALKPDKNAKKILNHEMKLEKHPLITEYLAGIPRLIKLSATILADKS